MVKKSRNVRRGDAQLKPLLRTAWPIVATQSALAIMQAVDTKMVSTLGTSELAAITPAGLTVMAAATFGTGSLAIVSTAAGNANGKGNRSRALQAGWQGLWAGLLIGIGLLLLLPTSVPLFALMGHEEPVRSLEVRYFEISLLALPCLLAATGAANYFVGTLNPRIALIGTLVAVITNIAADAVLIFGLFGFPKLGFAGAAWATVAASVSYLGFILVALVRERASLPDAVPHPRRVWKIVREGSPIGIQDMVETMAWGVVVVALVGRFGEAHLAATSVLIRCMQLSFLPADGVGVAVMSLVANSVGSGRLRLARAQAWQGFKLAGGYMATMAILFLVFRHEIMRAFSDDERVVAIGAQLMICVAAFQLFDAANIVYLHALIGAGDSAWPSLANAATGIIVLLGGGIAVVSLAAEIESLGVWLATTAYVITQAALMTARWRWGPWKLLA